MMALTETPPFTGPRRRGRPRKTPYPHESEPPRKKLRYTTGNHGRPQVSGNTPTSHARTTGAPQTAPRGRPSRRQSDINTTRRLSPKTPLPRAEPEKSDTKPRYSSAAAAASAMSQNDSYKPREERSWEEFHTDLDIDTQLMVFSAEEIDLSKQSEAATPLQALGSAAGTPILGHALQILKQKSEIMHGISPVASPTVTPVKRGPGRPPKRHGPMYGLGSPTPQKILPAPIHNPKERLVLPKPNFRQLETFAMYEKSPGVGVNFVDKSFATVGYQESDIFIQPRNLIRGGKDSLEDEVEASVSPQGVNHSAASGSTNQAYPRIRVEYDMDEQDAGWLEAINAERTALGLNTIRPQHFEITMTLIEKEWHGLEKRIPKPNPKPPQTHRPRSSSAAAVNGEPAGAEEQDTKCAVCDDGDCENTNAIVFCDGCDLAVHQECYGVPFIPEGQWLCRKCQLIGRNTPTCIFCPNIEGAFKQTSTLRWSHLLCAIWIPEVSLGNHTFMEPVMDVEKVPRQRWKLTCYICQQKMGACIQCSNKNCFVAFHVTCARRCRLYLKMKTQHGQIQDASALKGYCDKHVPTEWRKEHATDVATADAKLYYHRRMKGRRWADSQAAALAIPGPSQPGFADSNEEAEGEELFPTTSNKHEKAALQKKIWRLPSGAPIAPHLVFNNVVNGLNKYSIAKRKDFVADACKYWTLKREARRGAALLKRLQLQLDTFTSMEMTRRNFAAMGASGGPKLQQRIDFAESLKGDLGQISELCQTIVERENLKLRDAETLKDIVDTIYFPIYPPLWAAFDRAVSSDSNYNYFKRGFRELKTRLDRREYTTVTAFALDFGHVFHQQVYSPEAADEPVGIPGGEVNAPKHQTKMTKKLRARQNIKNVLPYLLTAAEKEADLEGKPRESPRRQVQAIMDNALLPGPDSAPSVDGETDRVNDVEVGQVLQPIDPNAQNGDVSESKSLSRKSESRSLPLAPDGGIDSSEERSSDEQTGVSINGVLLKEPAAASAGADDSGLNGDHHESLIIRVTPGLPALSNSGTSTTYHDPLTPPSGDKDGAAVTGNGGIPWYLEAFEPAGTTIHDERWAGRDALRGISEELSEMDDDAVNGLLDAEPSKEAAEPVVEDTLTVPVMVSKKKARPKRKRW